MVKNDNVYNCTHKNFVSITRDLIEIADTVLKDVVAQTEAAAIEIAEQIQKISTLSSSQSKAIEELLSDIHTEGKRENIEMNDIVMMTNSMVEQIVENAQNGNFEEAIRLGDSDEYKSLSKKTGALAKKLEALCKADEGVVDVLMPVITALQFQDRVRQSLENIIKIFDTFFNAISSFSHEKLPQDYAEEFWAKIESKFTSNNDRNIVRRVVYGRDSEEQAVAEDGDMLFF